MKRCPTCGLTLDDSQNYCTNDGTPLVADKSYDPQATMIVPPGNMPTTSPSGRRPSSPQTGWQVPPRPTSPPPAHGYQQMGKQPGTQPGGYR